MSAQKKVNMGESTKPLCSITPAEGSYHVLCCEDGSLKTTMVFKKKMWHLPGNYYGSKPNTLALRGWRYLCAVERNK